LDLHYELYTNIGDNDVKRSELTELQEPEDDIIINMGDVETAKRVTISPHLARHLKEHQVKLRACTP
jgi:hypothetical protein